MFLPANRGEEDPALCLADISEGDAFKILETQEDVEGVIRAFAHPMQDAIARLIRLGEAQAERAKVGAVVNDILKQLALELQECPGAPLLFAGASAVHVSDNSAEGFCRVELKKILSPEVSQLFYMTVLRYSIHFTDEVRFARREAIRAAGSP